MTTLTQFAVEQIIAMFAQTQEGRRGLTVEGAFSRCEATSEWFQDFARVRGVDVTLVYYEVPVTITDPNHPAMRRGVATYPNMLVGHAVVRLPDGSLIDWTARQFDPDSPHPARYQEPPEGWAPREPFRKGMGAAFYGRLEEFEEGDN
jgi:hypothetical protein